MKSIFEYYKMFICLNIFCFIRKRCIDKMGVDKPEYKTGDVLDTEE